MKKFITLLLLMFSFQIWITAQNFGIGTTTPMYPLTLVTPSGYGLVHSNEVVRIGTALGSDLFGGGFGFLGTFSDHRLVLGAGESSMNNFIINPGGNIGLGTLPSDAKLRMIPSNPNQNILDIKNYAGGQAFLVSSYDNIGIGTSTPDYPLTLRTSNGYGFIHDNGFVRVGTSVSGDDYGWIGTSSLHQLQLGSGGSSHISIEPNGNVGIGTTFPDAMLDVNGSMQIEGTNFFEFGGGLVGKYYYAGKIGYNNIIGLTALTFFGAGPDFDHLAFNFYGMGGTKFEGTMEISGSPTNPISLDVTGQTKLRKTATDPVAVDINGGIKVSGSNPAAFRLTATAGNMYGDSFNLSTTNCTILRIDNPYANNNPDALIFITPLVAEPVAVFYYEEDGYWYIRSAAQWRFAGLTNIGDCNLGCFVVQHIPVGGHPAWFTQNYSSFNVMILVN